MPLETSLRLALFQVYSPACPPFGATTGGVSVALFAPGWVPENGPGTTELPGSEAAKKLDGDILSDIPL